MGKISCAFLSLFLLIVISSFAQNGNGLPKGYAYSREILGGANPSAIPHENGGTSTRASKPSVQYFIYMEAATAVDIKSVWVDGVAFSVTSEKMTAPVMMQNATVPGNKSDTLVANTKNMLWQIQLKDKMKEGKRNAAMVQLAHSNAVVVVYSRKGKVSLLPIKKIKKLSPVALS
jgi:hypothetical protein